MFWDGLGTFSDQKTRKNVQIQPKSPKPIAVSLLELQRLQTLPEPDFQVLCTFSTKWSGMPECRYRRCFLCFSKSKGIIKTCRKRIFDIGSFFFVSDAEKITKIKIPHLQTDWPLQLIRNSEILIFVIFRYPKRENASRYQKSVSYKFLRCLWTY